MLFPDSNKIAPKIALILLVGCFFTVSNADDDDVIKPKTQKIGGYTAVVIDSATQIKSGLKTLLAKPAQHQAEFEAIGNVISIQPLLVLRERYLVAKAELGGAKSRLKQSSQSFKRQQELFRDGIAAKRTLQEQEALGSADQALVDASQVRVMAIANETRLLWGRELAEWALSDSLAKVKAFLSGKQQLLQITLPTNKQLASEVDNIAIEPSGSRSKARKAVFVSRSTQADNTMQGESYFFQATGDGLNVGMKVSAWIPEPRQGQFGVIVPESALVWYLDQVGVYIKTSKDTFIRRAVNNFSTTDEGYFIKDGITAGEEVVTVGGQLLLSEELRGQIPDED